MYIYNIIYTTYNIIYTTYDILYLYIYIYYFLNIYFLRFNVVVTYNCHSSGSVGCLFFHSPSYFRCQSCLLHLAAIRACNWAGSYWDCQMDVEPKIGGFFPPKWMVKTMENPMNKWMIWRFSHYFWKHPDIFFCWGLPHFHFMCGLSSLLRRSL